MSKPTLNEALQAVKILSELGVTKEAREMLNSAVRAKYSFNVTLFEKLSHLLTREDLNSMFNFFVENKKLTEDELQEIHSILIREKENLKKEPLGDFQEDHVAIVTQVGDKPKTSQADENKIVKEYLEKHVAASPSYRKPTVSIVGFVPVDQTKYNEIR